MFNLFKKKRKEEKRVRKESDLKISVVMPVYLGEYEGCAKDRDEKFKTAVSSFVNQKYKNKELIIVSDGCDIAEEIHSKYLDYPNVKFFKINKQSTFSGKVRYEGVKRATGDVICYLDSDDILGINHLSIIAEGFNNSNIDWIYYNDLLSPPNQAPIPRDVELRHGSIGTSTVAHRSDCKVSWNECDGYGHDWTFVQQLIKNEPNHKKIFGAEYLVCHVPNIF